MFVDTNILISLFIGDRIVKEILAHVKGEPLFCSVLQLSEIADWCIRENASISEAMSNIKKVVQIIPLTEEVCIEGAKIKHARRKAGYKNFPLIDGIIAASAKSIGQELLTSDEDLEGLVGVIYISK
ncbi:MAG: PIN domain-containing protein [Methanobacteriota archaeon]